MMKFGRFNRVTVIIMNIVSKIPVDILPAKKFTHSLSISLWVTFSEWNTYFLLVAYANNTDKNQAIIFDIATGKSNKTLSIP